MKKALMVMGMALVLGLLAIHAGVVQAWCGGFEAPMSQHYSYWTDTEQTWQNRYGECWITIEDESYHHDVDQALACGDATKHVGVYQTRIHANFDFDRYDIRQSDFTTIMGVITSIDIVEGRINAVDLVGHTDSYGTEGYNVDLGHNRASMVGALVRESARALGMPTPEITYASEGELSPVAPNDTADNRFLNRRVEGTLEIEIDFITYQ